MAKGNKKKENALVRYWKETKAEIQKVIWPTRKEVTNLTLIVLGVMVSMSAVLGIVDWLFTRLFALIVR